jgi:hypothetical protein
MNERKKERHPNKRIQKQNKRVILSLYLSMGPYAIGRKTQHIPEFYAGSSGRLIRPHQKISPYYSVGGLESQSGSDGEENIPCPAGHRTQ